jgi:environmental stress-induced protein Ves
VNRGDTAGGALPADDAGMSLRIIRYADVAPSLWRNGRGTTRELLVYNAGEAFVWRISVADVTASGAFSTFPGVDRSLTLCGDTAMALVVNGESRRLLPFDTVTFPGEASTSATLVDGPTVDLNVMTRRDTATSVVSTHVIDGEHEVSVAAGTTVLVPVDGSLQLLGAGLNHHLSTFDAVVVSAPADVLRLRGQGRVVRTDFNVQQPHNHREHR